MPEELTTGEQAVGKSFNPGGLDDVNKLKELFAEAADIVARLPKTDNKLDQIVIDNALTQTINASMACVKAVTFKL